MPVESSIYFRQENPDIIGSIAKGLSMADMIQQGQIKKAALEKEKDIRSIQLKNIVTNPDGTKSINNQGTMSSMIDKGYVNEANTMQGEIQKQAMGQAQLQGEQRKNSLAQADDFMKALDSSVDQPSYTAQLQAAAARGVDISKENPVYDPQAIQTMRMKMMDYKDRLVMQQKELESGFRQKELGIRAGERADKAAVLATDKIEKKKVLMNEIEDRRSNINSAIDTIDKQIDEYGTFEAFGPQNQSLDRLVDQIATDMSKLMDPGSVARPSEVELVKKGLVESGFYNSNETARKVMQEFKKEVERRADSAYKIRGIEKQAVEKDPPVPEIKHGAVIDGYVYMGGDKSKESSWKKK